MAGSQVIGILKALLTADSGEYSAAMKAAGAEAQELGKKLEKDLEPRQRSVNRLVSEFLGGGEIRRAQEYALAVEKVGGAANLTATDQLKVNKAMNDALEHYRVLGVEAPKNITALATATGGLTTQTTGLRGAFSALGADIVKTGAGMAAGLLSVQALQSGFRMLTQFIGDSVKAYLGAEAANKKMDAALRSSGEFSAATARQYRALASEMEALTVNADDLNAQAIATFTSIGQVGPAQMREAMVAAADLSSGLGIDLVNAAELVSKAVNGQDGALKRYGITVAETSDKGDRFKSVLDAVQSRFGGQAAAEIETSAGALKQLANSWDNVQEIIGQIIVDAPQFQLFLKSTNQLLQQQTQNADETSAAFLRYLQMQARLGLPLGDPRQGKDIHLAPELPAPDPEATKRLKAYREEIERLVRDLNGANLADKVKKLAEAYRQLTPAQLADAAVMERLTRASVELAEQGAKLPPALNEIARKHQSLTASQELATKISYGLTNAFLKQYDATLQNVPSIAAMTAEMNKFIPPADKALQMVLKVRAAVDLPSPPPLFSDAALRNVDLVVGSMQRLARDTGNAEAEVMALGAAFVSQMALAANSTQALTGFLDTAIGVFARALSGPGRLQRQLVTDFNDIKSIVKKLQELGVTPIRVKANAEGLEILKKQLEEALTAHNKKLDEAEAAQNRLTAAAQKYGFTWEDMNSSIRSTKINEWVQELKLDMDALTGAGIDQSAVLDAMSDDWSAMVQAALRTGTEIPESMRATIQALIDMGQLVDENGDLITDITKIPFAKSMTEGFTTVEKAVDRLGNLLREIFGKQIPEAVAHSVTWMDRLGRSVSGIQPPAGFSGFGGGQPGEVSTSAFTSSLAPSMSSFTSSSYDARPAGGGTVVLQMNGRDFYRLTLPDLVDTLKTFQVTRG